MFKALGFASRAAVPQLSARFFECFSAEGGVSPIQLQKQHERVRACCLFVSSDLSAGADAAVCLRVGS